LSQGICEVLPSREAEGEEEGAEPQPPPEPLSGAAGRRAAEQRGEHLPGQRYEERHAESDGGQDAVDDPPRLAPQQSEIGATCGAPFR